MTLDEFHEVYSRIGEIGASLVASEVNCRLMDFITHYPNLCHLWQPVGPHQLALGSFWWGVLRSFPEYIQYCPIDCLIGHQWANLILNHPQISDYCIWSKLDDEDWLTLSQAHVDYTIYKPKPDSD